MAVLAWRTGKHTLDASRKASEAALESATAAREANEQARRDSIEQTRPYVYAEMIPSLTGDGGYDLRVANVGKSAARNLTLSFDAWPDEPDDVALSLRTMFETPRAMPPGTSIRAIWRLEGGFTDGTTEAGMPASGQVTVTYTSDDSSKPQYTDHFDVHLHASGLWPVGEAGPNAAGLSGESLRFYKLGQALVRRVSELAR